MATWKCPRCGPVEGDPLHGDDERMHCPRFDCDEVVSFLTPEDTKPDTSWRQQGKKSLEQIGRAHV